MTLLVLLWMGTAPAAAPPESLAWLEAATPETRLVYGRLAAEELRWSAALLDALEEEARLRGQPSRLECLEFTHERHRVLHDAGAIALVGLETEAPDSLHHALQIGAVLREVRHLRARAEGGCPVLEHHTEWVPDLASGQVVVAVTRPDLGPPVWDQVDPVALDRAGHWQP